MASVQVGRRGTAKPKGNSAHASVEQLLQDGKPVDAAIQALTNGMDEDSITDLKGKAISYIGPLLKGGFLLGATEVLIAFHIEPEEVEEHKPKAKELVEALTTHWRAKDAVKPIEAFGISPEEIKYTCRESAARQAVDLAFRGFVADSTDIILAFGVTGKGLKSAFEFIREHELERR